MAAPERVAPEHAPARLGYIPALDGLRALAVVAVLLYHADQSWIPGGFLGVDVFFVISGYLITCLLLSDYQQTNGIGLKRFWYRRARRLLPALFAMLFVVSLYAVLFLPDVLDQLRGEVISALLYVENWFLVFRDLSYFQSAGRPPLLQHVWSLAVEEQYYLFWPLILMLVLTVWGKSRKALLIGVLAGVAISTLEMAILYHPYTDPVARVLRHRHARGRLAARVRARLRVGAVATHRPHRAQRGHRPRRRRRRRAQSSSSPCSSTSTTSTRASTAAGSCSWRSCRRCSSRQRSIPRRSSCRGCSGSACCAGSGCARTASTCGTGRSTWSPVRTPTSR